MKHDEQIKKLLSRTDWAEIQALSEKKTYQRKFQIIEAYTQLVSERGIHKVSYADIAKSCGIARQLVAHHFPEEKLLIILSYKYIYAGFQKFCSDRVLSRAGFLGQLETYFEGIVKWTVEKRAHSRFLIQFYALVHLDPSLSTILERNVQIGRERIHGLLMSGQGEGFFPGLKESDLARKAGAIHVQGFGFLLAQSWKKELDVAKAHAELFGACMSMLGIERSPRGPTSVRASQAASRSRTK